MERSINHILFCRKHTIGAKDIIDRFRLDENGEIVYAKDIMSGRSARFREGHKVKLWRPNSSVNYRVQFRLNGILTSISAPVVGFVLEFGKIPLTNTPLVIMVKSCGNNQRDFRARNLVYESISDRSEKGGMRVIWDKKRNEWRYTRKNFRGGKAKERYFAEKSNAVRFSIRHHQLMLKSSLREFWSHVGVTIDTEIISSDVFIDTTEKQVL